MLQTGTAAMLLSFDIETAAIAEHDDWHSHEHVPERLAIPGFLHGSRWISRSAGPRYFVLYAVQSLAVLASPAYLARLNNPSPWTAKMMRSYIGMQRALCTVEAGFGAGLGATAVLIRFAAADGAGMTTQTWLKNEVLGNLSGRPGIVSSHLFVSSLAAPMTREQQIRGQDASIPCALLVTGYDADAVTAIADTELARERFVAQGCASQGYDCGIYQLGFSMRSGDQWPGSAG